MDADHHRCVITLAGEPDAVRRQPFWEPARPMELIDLTKTQRGASARWAPRTCLPFIPIDGVTIEDCVGAGAAMGNEIWKRYRIPVFFYEAAATRPERVNLENVRRGQFEGLREELKKNLDRQPDVGEPKLHPTAGVTVVGARSFWCLQRESEIPPISASRTRSPRRSGFLSGGLRYVKSMGVGTEARGLAQVSIKLTDFEQTPMHRVYEMVKRERNATA